MSYYSGTCIEDCLKFSEQAVCTLVHLSKAATYILQSGSTVHSVENDGQSQTGSREMSFSMSYICWCFSICDVVLQ